MLISYGMFSTPDFNAVWCCAAVPTAMDQPLIKNFKLSTSLGLPPIPVGSQQHFGSGSAHAVGHDMVCGRPMMNASVQLEAQLLTLCSLERKVSFDSTSPNICSHSRILGAACRAVWNSVQLRCGLVKANLNEVGNESGNIMLWHSEGTAKCASVPIREHSCNLTCFSFLHHTTRATSHLWEVAEAIQSYPW
eukprot:1136487-Pelagomonas_calceolata.AAC.2